MKTQLPEIKIASYATEAKLSRKAGVPQPTLNLILRGKRRANPLHARQLARACEKMGIPMSLYDWLYPEDSESSLISRGNNRGDNISSAN